MNEEVIISIKGLRVTEDTDEDVEVITPGKLQNEEALVQNYAFRKKSLINQFTVRCLVNSLWKQKRML